GDASTLADRLEAAPRPPELGEVRRGFGARKAGQLERRERGGGVATVVLARNPELDLGGFELVAAYGLSRPRQPTLEQLLDLGARAERRVVVEVDVRDDGDPRLEQLERAVRLVTFGDQPPLA